MSRTSVDVVVAALVRMK